MRETGIGFGVAEALVEYGAFVTISSSNPSRVEAAVDKIQKAYPSFKAKISGHACNLGDHNTVEANLKTLLDTVTNSGKQKLDHIAYTAGDALATMELSKIDMDKVLKAGTVRFFGPLMLGKLAPAYMNAGPVSSIILTTGTVSEKPIQGWSAVAPFATGLQGMARALALDLKPLRVNLVSPGAVETELWNTLPSDEARQDLFKRTAERLPTGRVGQVEDVAESYLYLMRDGNVTGTMVSTNGGALLV
jgi:NAD(P)-dependent dehydrogenase (short-subunit alcohol dehydrogenase family)